MYTKKSGVEIKYLNVKHEYFMQRSLDFSRGFHFAEADNEFYWKKEDLSIILKKIFESDNLYLMPWYARIFPYFKNESGLTVELNDEILLDKYKTS